MRICRADDDSGPRPGSPGDESLAVRVHGLRRSYGAVVAVDGVELDLRRAEQLAIVGPSGCGKTTILRLIAGLETPDAGTIEIAGRPMSGPGGVVPPERRGVGMVFQDLALFPHLTVADNVGYGLRGHPDRARRVTELLELIDLADAGERPPHHLSGGMQQRVAVARALAPRPDVVLLDEPFSNLDAAMRDSLRADVRAILRATGAASILVTHDQDEALTLGDRVAVMARGRVEQCDVPDVIYGEPATPFVAGFVGVANLVDADVRGGIATTPIGRVSLIGASAARPDGPAVVVLRPEHIELTGGHGVVATDGSWTVEERRFTGAEVRYRVVAADGRRWWVAAGHDTRRFQPGDGVALRLRDVETVAFDRPAPGDCPPEGEIA